VSRPATSELLMFQVGSRVYATEVGAVRSIRMLAGAPGGDLVTRSALGEPVARERGMVVSCGDQGDRTLVVDQVLGVRAVTRLALKPMPAFAAACLRSAAVTGFALLDGAPTLLVDLPTLVRERCDGRADSLPQERPDDG
jgi:chemotaxis signal transduction protein